MRDLVGKTALVTGGGKGVGKEIARSLASRGADVIINCFHSYAIAKATKAELEGATGARISLMRASVAKVEQVRQLFERVEAEHGGLDILVNNAASGRLGPVSDIQPEHFARALDTNLLGSFWCSIYAAPLMAKRGGGTIVNVSSLGAGLVPDNYLVVGTSKAAVEALTRHLAIELAPLKIRVNTASCSLIEGDVAKLFPRADELEAVTVATTPLGRLATAKDLSGIVTFLTSDLSSWVTGQVVLADGGASLANAMLSPPRKSVPILPAPVLPTQVQARSRVDAGQPQSARQRRDFITSTTASAPDGVAVEGPRHPGDGGRGPQDVDDPVVVVGMGLAVPGANSPDEYWAQMMEGAERFVEAPPGRWCVSGIYSADTGAQDKTYQARAGFMTGFQPDSRLAGDIARGVVGSEHTTRWLRHCVYQALRDVHGGEGDRAALAVGYTADGSQHLEEALVLAGATASVKEALAAHDDGGWGEGRAAYRQKLEESFSQGGSDPASYLSHEVARAAVQGILPTQTSIFVVDTACSSSLYTIDIGMMLLNQGKYDIAICGGAFALAPRGAVMFAKLRGLSRDGAVRSLDRSADGVLFSDGAGVVVLKRLSRAVADGDHVLGIIRGVGSSSDGKGKAIYAPNPTGQRLAIDRALCVAGVSAEQIDWVVAHATGTPAGDAAEFSALRAAIGDNQRTWVTSNKSLIGHTGWAAGVVSVIEVILALQHETIPRQHRFEAPPQAFQMDGTCLSIPTAPVAWPPYIDRPRFASVSGFGFGGTNAHLIVEEHTGRRRPLRQAPATPERVAIVGLSAHMPGVARGDLASWAEGAVQPEASFGERYDPPSFERLRLPPSTVRTMDRSQLMALECAFQLQEQLGGLLVQYQDKTGTLIGHMGPTRNAVMYSLRTYLEPIENLLAESPSPVRRLHERVSEYVRGTVPPPNEDAFPGSMPNVIPSRVANHLDLHGLNMTVDTGPAATLTALEVARLYLQSGVLDVAFVGGVNGNSTAAITEVLRGRLRPGTIIAEGAVMFALVREPTATDHGLTVLAYLEGYEERADVGLGAEVVTVGPGTSTPRTYLGADGAIGVLKALQSRSQDTLVACVGAPGAPVVTLRLRKEPAPGATGLALPSREAAQVQSTAAGHENAGPYAPRPPPVQPSSPPAARRYTVDLAHSPLTAGRPPQPFFPNGTLVLTDIPERVDEVLASPNQALLLSVRPLSRSARGRAYLRDVNPELVRAALAALPSRPRHIRVITDLTAAIDPENGISQRPDALLALHDLLFSVLQQEGDDLVQVGGSVIITMLRGVRGGHLHAFTGLFSGFAKSAALELGGVLVYAMATSTDDLATAVNEATTESEGRRLVPLVVYDNGRRLAPRIRRAGPETAGSFVLGDGSVVVAVGGSRGIAAEALKALASRVRPTIYVLGSTDLSAVDEGPADHEGYIRWSLSRRPGTSVAVANRAYLKASQARLARANLSDLSSRNGGRTHYLVVDVRDAVGVQKAIDSVFAAEGRVDLVVNAAGINRSRSLRDKSWADFRAVRDLKVDGYQNLKRAFAGRPPRVWCNFSSLIGFGGQPGEVDYASANDFLSSASSYENHVGGLDEYAICWNLWRDVGLGADPLLQSLLRRSHRFSAMTTDEGVSHFLDELSGPRRHPYVLIMGDGELSELGLSPEQVSPTRRPEPWPQPASSPAKGRGLLGRDEIERHDSEVVVHKVLAADSSYLDCHRVAGIPALPGTFYAEMAAEAAQFLEPGRAVVGLEDLVFSSFLKVRSGRPVTARTRAQLLARDDRRSRVRVSITTDVFAPDGRPLVRDRKHFEGIVQLATEPPAPPTWQPWPGDDLAPATDPYYVRNPAVHLGGIFVAGRDHRLHPYGNRATLDLRPAAAEPDLRGFLLPAVALDALLRVGVLDSRPDGFQPLAVPTSIERVSLYLSADDCELALRHPRVDLYSMTPYGDQNSVRPTDRAIAATPGGHVLIRVDNMSCAVVGYINPGTGEYRPSPRLSQVRAAVPPANYCKP